MLRVEKIIALQKRKGFKKEFASLIMRRKRKVKFINSNVAGNLTLQHITNKKIEWSNFYFDYI